MCVAFASGGTSYDGTTFVGSADGNILRFMEQATDLSVKAHPLDGNEVAKVRLPPPSSLRRCMGDDSRAASHLPTTLALVQNVHCVGDSTFLRPGQARTNFFWGRRLAAHVEPCPMGSWHGREAAQFNQFQCLGHARAERHYGQDG